MSPRVNEVKGGLVHVYLVDSCLISGYKTLYSSLGFPCFTSFGHSEKPPVRLTQVALLLGGEYRSQGEGCDFCH
jgi:hypothetical protein